jgi:hypothetical protein
MPRKKGTIEKVTEAVTGISEIVIGVGETVGGIAGTVNEVVHAVRAQAEKPRRKQTSKKPKLASTARAKPQPTPPRLAASKKPPTRRQKPKKS